MKTFITAISVTMLSMIIACQQEKSSSEADRPAEDGFTEDQLKDMARIQQVADKREEARMDSLINTHELIRVLSVFPFDSLSAPEQVTFNAITDAIKEQGEIWKKTAFDPETHLLEISSDNYLVKFKGYEDSHGEIATIVVSEWYHATNKVLSFYYYSPAAKRLTKNNEDIHQLNPTAFLDADYVKRSKLYNTGANYDVALDYQLTNDGIAVLFNPFTASNYLHLEDITDEDVVTSYVIKWDYERAAFSDPVPELDDNTGAAALDLIREKGLEWIPLMKQDNEWIIYDECLYGSGGLTFDENGQWVEFSGGGDANSHDIESLKKTPEGLTLTYVHSLTGNTLEKSIRFVNRDVMVMNSTEGEARFVLKSAAEKLKTISQVCDEEEL